MGGQFQKEEHHVSAKTKSRARGWPREVGGDPGLIQLQGLVGHVGRVDFISSAREEAVWEQG